MYRGERDIYIYFFFQILFTRNIISFKWKFFKNKIAFNRNSLEMTKIFFFFCFFLLKQWLLRNSLFCKRWILLQPIKYKFTEMNFLVANQIQVYNSMNYLTAWQLHWFKKRCRHAFHEDVFQSNLKWLISHMISIIFTYDIHVHLSTL